MNNKDSSSESIPGKPDYLINLYVVIGIIFAGIVIFITMQYISEEDAGLIAFILSVTITSIVAISAFVVVKRYKHEFFSKVYLFLGFGFTSYVIAELFYYSLDSIFGIEAYPSIADVFFFALYPFVLVFLLLNIKNFHAGYTKKQKIWMQLY